MLKRLMGAGALMALVLSVDSRMAFAGEKSEQTVIKSRSFTIAKLKADPTWFSLG
jgi:hypothetical protein